MRILSLDIGIKNLSYCVLNKSIENKEIIDSSSGYTNIITNNLIIEDWGIINLFDTLSSIKKCECVYRGKVCDKIASINCSKDEKTKYLCDKKSCLKEVEKLVGNGYKRIEMKKKTTKDISLEEYGMAIFNEFEKIKEKWVGVEKVLIENQPVLKNPTMKSIQMMVYSYFIYFGIRENKVGKIQLCSAMNKLNQINKLKIEKLKEMEFTKETYKNRKESSVKVAKKLLENTNWEEYLSNHIKKDDLTDCFLQGLTVILV